MSWIQRLVGRGRREQELDAEVESYFEIVIERLMAGGLSREEAARAARLQFEGPEQVKEKVRDARTGMVLETTLRDIRYAWRTLRKNPGFTVVAVLTLGLGIGANAAIFSLINAVMLRLLPVQKPEQLVLLTDPAESGVDTETTNSGVQSIFSYPEFLQLRLHNSVFSGMLAAQSDVSNIDVFPAPRQPVKARTQLVSGDFFPVLGVKPVIGRVFTSQEDKVPGANPVTVISYGFWQRQFAGNPNILGRTVRVGQGVFQIVGVAPAGFRGILVGSDADFWIPISMQQQVLPGRDYLKPRDTLWLQVMARLAPGSTMPRAEAAINVTFQQVLREQAGTLPTEKERRNMLTEKIKLRPGSRGASALRGSFADPLVLLMAMVGVVLLIACANIANLMLARASGRQREIGVRLALGAARGRLIRQLLTESLLVAFFGGLLGILLSTAGSHFLLALVSTSVNDLDLSVPLDYHVVAFTAAISLLTLLLSGLVPAFRGTRLDIARTFAANVRGGSSSSSAQTGRLLGITQIALALVLLMGAALFLRSLSNLLTQGVGYDREHLLMITLDPASAGYQGPGATALYERLREQMRTAPGVRSATLSDAGLFNGRDSGDHLSIEGSPVHDREQLESAWTEIGADYFKTLGIPLLRGREINASDTGRNAPVCMINETFQHRFFAGTDPIGKHITDEYPTTRETFEIIGVVADSKEHSPDEVKSARFYSNISHPIGTVGSVTFLLNTSRDPGSVAGAVRDLVRRIDSNLTVLDLKSVDQQIDRSLITQRLVADLGAFFAIIALFMAAIGLYGVLSYSTSRRTNEIGIRMALGASASTVRRMVLGETLRMVGIGVAVGLPCAVALGRLIASRLYGLGASDPASIGWAITVVLAAGLLAGYVPAYRASRIDPMVSLRHD